MRCYFNAVCILGLCLGLLSCQTSENFTREQAKATEQAGWDSVPTILAAIKAPSFPKDTLFLDEMGGKGDSLFNNQPIINQTINDLSAKGGGVVVLEEGNYFSDGPIVMKSNVNLHLKKGALLFFTSKPESYLPAVKVRWEGTVCYNYSPLIYAYQEKNIALTGQGTVDGMAIEWSKTWRVQQKPDKKRLREMGNDTIPEEQRVFADGFLDLNGDGKDDGYGDGKQHYLRPTLVEFYECENILIDSLTFQNSPFWTVHPVFSKKIIISNLKVYGETLNDDGVDPDSCEDVLIENCTIETRDDAISIKAGRDQDAWNRMGSKNIVVRNNNLLSGANAFCIGSEMSGGVEYVFAENNFIANGQHALNFKCNLDRGGQVQHIYLRNTEIESCRDAMFIFRMDYHGYRGNNFPTKFNDFYVSNITCGNVEEKAFKIVGVAEEPIKNLYFNNIEITDAGEESQFEHVENVIMDSVFIGKEKLQL